MIARWGTCFIEVGDHDAVNPDHGSMIACYGCKQSWFYADAPPPCKILPEISSYLFFKDAQDMQRWPW